MTTAGNAPALREALVENAVKFLSDPSVQTSAMSKKFQFLESKGLTQAEIDAAVSRAGASAAPPPPSPPTQALVGTPGPGLPVASYAAPQAYPAYPAAGGYPYPAGLALQQQPPPLGLGWKDYFVAATVAGGVGYGAWSLGKQYLLPLISWPADARLDGNQKLLETQVSGATAALQVVEKQSADMMGLLESHSAQLDGQLSDMVAMLRDWKAQEAARTKATAQIQEDLDQVKALIPQILKKTKESQASLLTDIQGELKALKSLLLNRRFPGPPPPATGTSGTAALSPEAGAASGGGSGTGLGAASGANRSDAGSPGPASETVARGDKSVSGQDEPALARKPSIPAWQLKGSSQALKPAAETAGQSPPMTSKEPKEP